MPDDNDTVDMPADNAPVPPGSGMTNDDRAILMDRVGLPVRVFVTMEEMKKEETRLSELATEANTRLNEHGAKLAEYRKLIIYVRGWTIANSLYLGSGGGTQPTKADKEAGTLLALIIEARNGMVISQAALRALGIPYDGPVFDSWMANTTSDDRLFKDMAQHEQAEAEKKATQVPPGTPTI